MRIIHHLSLAALIPIALISSACSTPEEVSGFNGWMPAVSGLSADCSKPFSMSHDCSGLNGPTRLIDIDGTEVKVAGSQDGTVVMLMDSKVMTSTYPNVAEGTPKLVKWLETHGIKLLATTAIVLPTGDHPIAGYYLVFDGDAYSLVKELTKKK